MKVLKLCTSDELAGDIPDVQRAYRVAEQVIREATGEQVETKLHLIWPGEKLPGLVEGWVEQFQPDVVLVVVSPFWMTFASTPLRLRRRFKRFGEWLGKQGQRAAEHPRIGNSRLVRAGQRASLTLIGGDYHFEPSYVTAVTERVVRKILAAESVEVVVRGPLVALGHHGNRRSLADAERRRRTSDEQLRELCQRLHVTYVGKSAADAKADRQRFTGDLVHTDAEAHRERGELEGGAIARLWLATLQTAGSSSRL